MEELSQGGVVFLFAHNLQVMKLYQTAEPRSSHSKTEGVYEDQRRRRGRTYRFKNMAEQCRVAQLVLYVYVTGE